MFKQLKRRIIKTALVCDIIPVLFICLFCLNQNWVWVQDWISWADNPFHKLPHNVSLEPNNQYEYLNSYLY